MIKTSEEQSLSLQDLIEPFTDIVTTVLWKYVKKDNFQKGEESDLEDDQEEKEIAENSLEQLQVNDDQEY